MTTKPTNRRDSAMINHTPTEPVTNERGDESHPAFGSISASRISCTPGQVLFDSDILHDRVIRVRIGRMVRIRDLKTDRLHPTRELIEVDMSEAQWASFVSSMNTQGVPCTLRRLPDERDVPGLPHAPRLAQSIAEVHGAAQEAFSAIQQAMADLEALDPKAGVRERREALRTLRACINNAVPNVDFAGKMLAEHAENVVQKARADVEAMVAQKTTQLGIDAPRFPMLDAAEQGSSD
jgi:hypothetical protein